MLVWKNDKNEYICVKRTPVPHNRNQNKAYRNDRPLGFSRIGNIDNHIIVMDRREFPSVSKTIVMMMSLSVMLSRRTVFKYR